jgi:DnaJ-class molecular chaperone|tara:strand:+ start:5783 stop:6676 length:894 start_codon:yes stop_codon:yes gene_type:complete
MDFNCALESLEISEPYTRKELKKQYFKKALLYHPDKNDNPDSNKQFHIIQDAYVYLSNNLDSSSNESYESRDCVDNDSYFVVIEQLFNIMRNSNITNTAEIINVILENCHLLSLSTFEKTDKHTALKIFGYIERYSAILCIDRDMVAKFREIIREKLQDDELVILNPSIDNLLNNEVYVLEHDGNTYYIPLWHEEVTYETGDHSLIVKCIPQLPEHVYIDENNNIHIHVKISVVRALVDKNICVSLGRKVFKIITSELKIMARQSHIIRENGISTIDPCDNYNTDKKSNIIIHIELY